MNFKRLLDEKRIEAVEAGNFSLDVSLNDLDSAENSFQSEDYDWSINIAYTAVLKACIKFMQYLGYRSIGKEHHKNAFEFIREAGFDRELVNYFDEIRKTRNNFIYNFVEENDKNRAEETILKARDFVQKIGTFVQKIGTGDSNGKA